MSTTLAQNCYTALSSAGTAEFVIESSITATTDLLRTEIFVFEITAATNPKADIFLRVGTVYDITALPVGRQTAILNGSTLYLSSGFIVSFSDVQTATTAKLTIQSRVNSLVTAYLLYVGNNPDQFAGNTVTVTPIPIQSSSNDNVQVAYENWGVSKAALATATQTVNTAEATLGVTPYSGGATTILANLQAQYSNDTKVVQALTPLVSGTLSPLVTIATWESTQFGNAGTVPAINTAMLTFITAAQAYVASDHGTTATGIFNTAISVFQVAQANLAGIINAEPASLRAASAALNATSTPPILTGLGTILSFVSSNAGAESSAIGVASTALTNAQTALTNAQTNVSTSGPANNAVNTFNTDAAALTALVPGFPT